VEVEVVELLRQTVEVVEEEVDMHVRRLLRREATILSLLVQL
jgi:hypothetical protein